MHLHFNIVSETEKVQLCRHNTIHETEKFTTTNYVNITEYVYLNQFLSLCSVSYSRLVLQNDIDKR